MPGSGRKRIVAVFPSFLPSLCPSFRLILTPVPQSHARTRDTQSLETVRQAMSPMEARLVLGVKGRLPTRGTEF